MQRETRNHPRPKARGNLTCRVKQERGTARGAAHTQHPGKCHREIIGKEGGLKATGVPWVGQHGDLQ